MPDHDQRIREVAFADAHDMTPCSLSSSRSLSSLFRQLEHDLDAQPLWALCLPLVDNCYDVPPTVEIGLRAATSARAGLSSHFMDTAKTTW